MKTIHTYQRAVGHGPTALLLHSSAASGKQWRHLAARLADRYRVITPDLIGYGCTPPWHAERPMTLTDEVTALAPVIGATDGPMHVVGHSMGAAVALELALTYPDKVASLTLYEPVRFHLLVQDAQSMDAEHEAVQLYTDVWRHVIDGHEASAARQFISFWGGDYAWTDLDEEQQARLTKHVPQILCDFDAAFGSRVTPAQLSKLTMPVLIMQGGESPLVTQRISDIIAATLSNVERHRLTGVGHLGPVTHAQSVNTAIAEFIDDQQYDRTRTSIGSDWELAPYSHDSNGTRLSA